MVDDAEQSASAEETPPAAVGLGAAHLQDPAPALVDGGGAQHGDPVGLLDLDDAQVVFEVVDDGQLEMLQSLDPARADDVVGGGPHVASR